ncbi:lysophospholipase-like protein 1 isoform X1 [Acanthaster planci]|uniref:palmitoyl-protein hydrolase n=1 Tax=Acanthaster planci TaxID=133434 RepID=A0A8B7YG49_ACAPL|nr:lysophospholipase-like protein 1 isoform X1 [Acanthaster planci]XP_022090622.1 lysophospholipase-like protein 1 isoform X1 [Acanthaster planci]
MAAPTKAANLKTVIVGSTRKHSASVIFLHGSGDTGEGVLGWIRSLVQDAFRIPHVKFIFPSAPARPYTPAGGALSTVWYDRVRIAPNVPELLETINPLCEQLGKLIDAEVAGGIPQNRIILGGFSMGGGMAMHLAYRFHHDAAGVFALSSFLNEDSVVYKVMTSKACLPPLFACQGLRDNLVLSDWSKETVRQLSDRGALCEYHTFPKLYHEMNAQELHMLTDWIKKQVPDDGS